MKKKLFLIIILLIATFFRLYDLNWDSGQHLHPDERFLTMVANDIKLPASIGEYLNPQESPLNPANAGYDFFVYGTFPLFLVKIIAVVSGLNDYANITLLGRLISALFDIGTVFLVFLITKSITVRGNRNIEGDNFFKELVVRASSSSLSLRAEGQPPKSWLPSISSFVNNYWALTSPYLAAIFYTLSVLPIQLSHFFAVDTFLTFFITLSFYLLLRPIKHISAKHKLPASPAGRRVTSYQLRVTAALGAAFGFALSSKISALLFLPIIILGLILITTKHQRSLVFRSNTILAAIMFIAFTYITFRLASPYAFKSSNILNPAISPQFIDNLKTLKSFNNAQASFPPAVQWIKTKPIIFPLRNMLYYGLGMPLGLLAIGGVIYTLWLTLTWLYSYMVAWFKYKRSNHQKIKKSRFNFSFLTSHFTLLLILIWTLGLFLYQSTQFSKPLRYFLPIYPFLAALAALFTMKLILSACHVLRQSLWFGVICYLLFVILWPVSFVSIYSRPHSRVAASRWIYENIPAGSTLTCEHWDDCLPLPLSNQNQSKYNIVQLPLYDKDTPKKWKQINTKLAKADYIILSSNRLYGSITSAPERYPQTNNFYQQLFASANNNLWVKKAEFKSRPRINIPFFNSQFPTLNFCISPPFEWYGKIAQQSNTCSGLPAEASAKAGLTIIDDYADESFTVYDHPKVIIFKKKTEKKL